MVLKDWMQIFTTRYDSLEIYLLFMRDLNSGSFMYCILRLFCVQGFLCEDFKETYEIRFGFYSEVLLLAWIHRWKNSPPKQKHLFSYPSPTYALSLYFRNFLICSPSHEIQKHFSSIFFFIPLPYHLLGKSCFFLSQMVFFLIICTRKWIFSGYFCELCFETYRLACGSLSIGRWSERNSRGHLTLQANDHLEG